MGGMLPHLSPVFTLYDAKNTLSHPSCPHQLHLSCFVSTTYDVSAAVEVAPDTDADVAPDVADPVAVASNICVRAALAGGRSRPAPPSCSSVLLLSLYWLTWPWRQSAGLQDALGRARTADVVSDYPRFSTFFVFRVRFLVVSCLLACTSDRARSTHTRKGLTMAMSWSHTHEAYADARENLFRLDRETLQVIYAEWKSCADPFECCPHMNEEVYERALQYAATLPDDVLAEFIWEQAEQLATCANGGHEAWLCPFGCGCHLVPFDCDIPHEERISCD